MENLPISYSQTLQWYGEVMHFVWDVVKAMFPPTVQVKNLQWEPQDGMIVSVDIAVKSL